MRTDEMLPTEAEHRFRTMADRVPVLIRETDETGVVNVNGHYLDFFGASLEQLLGMGWADYLHPEDAAGYIVAYVDASSHRRAYDYECRFVGSSVDVTELVETRESLEKKGTKSEGKQEKKANKETTSEKGRQSSSTDLDGICGRDPRQTVGPPVVLPLLFLLESVLLFARSSNGRKRLKTVPEWPGFSAAFPAARTPLPRGSNLTEAHQPAIPCSAPSSVGF